MNEQEYQEAIQKQGIHSFVLVLATDSFDRIVMGPERKSKVLTEEDKELTAYHEAGHAIVGLTVPSHDPVYKVSIIPRGRALGVTLFLPEKDRFSASEPKDDAQFALYVNRPTVPVLLEILFGVPGMGQWFVKGAINRDYSVVLGTQLIYFSIVIALNLVVDLLYALIDPRIRYR